MVIRKRMRIAAAVLVMCTMAGCSLFPDGTRVVEKDAGESTQQTCRRISAESGV